MIAVPWPVLPEGLGFLLASSALGAAGHLLAKAGAERAGGLPGALLEPTVWAAGALYAASFALWLGFLRGRPASAAVPCAALTYALVALAGRIAFGERLAPAQWAGLGLILAGVWLLARAGR